ncbi:MAG TPA: arginine--tRNA ligase [Candidatus Saccharimonas sp.]|jgi:arginyl-tRNA synthetase|nr:arginine--tRNA ligase [Candidatus Saccharimonas sp.]
MEQLAQQIELIITELYDLQVSVKLERPDPQFGDYATSVAMQLAGKLGKPPREIAEQLRDKLSSSASLADVTIAGPGFLNIALSDAELQRLATREPATSRREQTYVMEYSCPNAFKELHTGHLYQTLAGDVLARLLERSGATVRRTSFGGDVGLHVAKCLWGMVATLGGVKPEALQSLDDDAFARARWISGCYVRGAGQYEADETAKQEIDELNKAIYAFHAENDHESPLAQLYWTTRGWSYDYFNAFYRLIQVDQMHQYAESETAPVGLAVVREQLAAGNLQESDGAVVFVGDETKHLHTRVFVTSKGLPTYETKDIGVIWLEKEQYNFDHRVLITGNDQKEYMRVIFTAAELFRPELAGTMTHLTNGTVRFGDGKKMSSRLGNVSRAVDVVEVVREKVRELVKDESLIETVTLGAIKYVFARYRLGGDIAFDIDDTVSLAGNSGPYIQYAHARACSILAKSTANQAEPDVHYTTDERALLRKIGEYPEVIERAMQELAPHHICTYLYELAQEFNRFYEHNRVIDDEREAERVGLVARYAQVLSDGLGILGIAAPQKM